MANLMIKILVEVNIHNHEIPPILLNLLETYSGPTTVFIFFYQLKKIIVKVYHSFDKKAIFIISNYPKTK